MNCLDDNYGWLYLSENKLRKGTLPFSLTLIQNPHVCFGSSEIIFLMTEQPTGLNEVVQRMKNMLCYLAFPM
jgi:hypothetical protein